MNAPEIMLVLILVRLVIPFGTILLVGEWTHRREQARFYRR
jgi:FtsZ-interacting cell division protein ZipA